ncbi:hypothetical protein [Fibrobacter sp. UWR1]|nr:hypothetical protein [Fibrobacter sp. UWR1]PZW65109.1 hypothetical protein C8E88_103627 [Fibrobacter sp. UWR1]
MSENGFISAVCSDWGEDNPPIATDTTTSTDSLMLEDSFLALQELVEIAAKKDVIVIGAIFPQSPAYKNTGAFGRHGMRRSLAAKMVERIKEYQSKNFILFDENKMGDHDYTSSMASYYDHLCAGGAKRFSTRLDSLIATLE